MYGFSNCTFTWKEKKRNMDIAADSSKVHVKFFWFVKNSDDSLFLGEKKAGDVNFSGILGEFDWPLGV